MNADTDPSFFYFSPINESYQVLLQAWSQSDRLEELTCRPILKGQRQPPSSERITLLFFTKDEIEPVGKISYFDINPRNRSAEFGYVIHPRYRGQGYGASMLTCFISHIFETTQFNKLYCQTGAFNTSSCQLLEKVGLKREGVLRQHHELDGKLWDDYIYSILRLEWAVGR